jgi:hypothetical protein
VQRWGEAREELLRHIDDDGKGATWICWRSNSCGYADGFRLHGTVAPEKARRKPIRRPDPEPNPELPDKLVEYFASFGVSRQTLEAFGIYRTERLMPVLTAEGVQTRETARRACGPSPHARGRALTCGQAAFVTEQTRPACAGLRTVSAWSCEPQAELRVCVS